MESVYTKPIAVILDREGVITQKLAEGEYVIRPEQAVVDQGVIEALLPLCQADISLFIASNQSCVSRGLTTLQQTQTLHTLILNQLASGGVHIVDSALCPHEHGDGCDCRKPLPGMFLSLAQKHGIDLERSATVGDAARDMAAAKAAGVPVRVFLGAACDDATHCVSTLAEACRIILGRAA